MPRPRKPDNVLELKGAKKHNPQRFRDRNKQASDDRRVGRVPSHLTDEQKAAWKELVNDTPPGVLQRADRIAIEMAAGLMVQIRSGDTQASKVALLAQLLNKMGMTPVGRNNVPIQEPKAANPFADL